MGRWPYAHAARTDWLDWLNLWHGLGELIAAGTTVAAVSSDSSRKRTASLGRSRSVRRLRLGEPIPLTPSRGILLCEGKEPWGAGLANSDYLGYAMPGGIALTFEPAEVGGGDCERAVV